MSAMVIDGNKKDNLTFKLRRKVNLLYFEYKRLFLYNLRKLECNKLFCNVIDL
jgi:hypothetical protein